MARMGSIMAAGVLDAGGRNATIGLRSSSGYFRRTSVIGLAVFTGYWYWYPLRCAAMLQSHGSGGNVPNCGFMDGARVAVYLIPYLGIGFLP